MEYQEWKKRDGQVIVLCSFEELLMDYYQVSSMVDVQKNVEHNGEYIIQCPFCKAENYMKKKLYVKDDLTVGHCFKCHRAFVNVTDTIEYNIRVPKSQGSFNYDLIKLENSNWTLDMYEKDFLEYDEVGYNYLLGRHKFLGNLSKILKFKYHNHNVIMPFFL